MKIMSERAPLNEIEKKLVEALGQVTFLPASYDKRFCRCLAVDGLYTEKQKRYLHFVFNKYRRQIKNYQKLAFELQPERFDVKVKFERDLFSAEDSHNVSGLNLKNTKYGNIRQRRS